MHHLHRYKILSGQEVFLLQSIETEYFNIEIKFVCSVFYREPESTAREVMFTPEYQFKIDKKPSQQRSYL